MGFKYNKIMCNDFTYKYFTTKINLSYKSLQNKNGLVFRIYFTLLLKVDDQIKRTFA